MQKYYGMIKQKGYMMGRRQERLKAKKKNREAKKAKVLRYDDLTRELIETRGELNTFIGKLQEIIDNYKDEIESSPELLEITNGVSGSFGDLAKSVLEISLKHMKTGETKEIGGVSMVIPTTFETGVVSQDDEMDVIKLHSEYIAVNEKIAHLATTSFISILSKIKTIDNKGLEMLAKVRDDGIKQLEGVTNGK